MVRLFVYGTLRRPGGGPDNDSHYHPRIADAILSAQPARLRNAVLYDFGAYPGVGSGSSTVIGDLFDLRADALEITDQIEGHPDFYTRRIESVETESGTQVEAWVYWAPPGLINDFSRVDSGDWFDRPPGRSNVPIEAQLADDRERVTREDR